MIRIAGAFRHYEKLLPLIIKYHLTGIVSVYDGVNSPWCGGRIWNLYPTFFDETKLRTYNTYNIPVFLTFSNSQIDLSNPWSLEILKKLNGIGEYEHVKNGVVIVSEGLREFIRNEYPNLTIIYSITGHPDNYEDFDIALEQKYDLIVPRFENVFNPKFLEVADTSKYEILVNDTCRYGCKFWHQHFEAINKANINPSQFENLSEIQECWIPKFNPNIESEHECMDLSTEAIQKCISYGYKNFKISGRELKSDEYIKEISKYIERIKTASKNL